jgi:hypothetical protein
VRFRKALGDALKVLEHLQEYQKNFLYLCFFGARLEKISLQQLAIHPPELLALGKTPHSPLQEMEGFMSFCCCHNICNLYHKLTFMTPD